MNTDSTAFGGISTEANVANQIALLSSAMLRQAQETTAHSVTLTANCENCSNVLEALKVLDDEEDEDFSYLSVFHTIFLATILLMSTVGNGLVTLVLLRKKNLSPSSRLVLSLCCSNLLLSCSVLPFSFVASVLKRWTFGLPWCWTSGFLLQLVMGASNLTLAAIAIDRYYAIVTPMTYSVRITSAKSAFFLLATWLLALLSSLPPFLGQLRFSYQPTHCMCLVVWEDSLTYTTIVLIVNILFPLLIMSVSYGCIFQIARSKYKTTNIGTISAIVRFETQESLSRNQIVNIRQLQRHYVRKPSWLSIVLQSPVKGFAVICCILGVFCLCWTPHVISLIVGVCGISLTVWQQQIAFEFVLLSVPSYPVIYGLLNRSIRKDLFLWIRPKNQWKMKTRNVAPPGLLDYVPPFSHLQFTTPSLSTAKTVAMTEKYHRKTSDDSGRYSLPPDELEADSSSGSQLSRAAVYAKTSSQESLYSRRSSSQDNAIPFKPLSSSQRKLSSFNV